LKRWRLEFVKVQIHDLAARPPAPSPGISQTTFLIADNSSMDSS
jgi:hypothetical protein